MDEIGYIYTCENCGWEKRTKTIGRGIGCLNCKGMAKRNLEKEKEELQNQRNKLNRKISNLKRETLQKPTSKKEDRTTELATCVFCGKTFDSDGRSDCGCHDGEAN